LASEFAVSLQGVLKTPSILKVAPEDVVYTTMGLLPSPFITVVKLVGTPPWIRAAATSTAKTGVFVKTPVMRTMVLPPPIVREMAKAEFRVFLSSTIWIAESELNM
jgi:hypothetical protein